MEKSDPPEEKKREDYDDAVYKALEKNNRVIKVLLQPMSNGDMKIIVAYKTAKEIWKALKDLGTWTFKETRFLRPPRTIKLQSKEKMSPGICWTSIISKRINLFGMLHINSLEP